MAQQQSSFKSPQLDGQTATFIWRGKTSPGLVGDLNGWDLEHPLALSRVKPNLWEYRVQLPAKAYIEYVFYADGEILLDPHNPRRVSNGFDGKNNFFYMPGGGPSPLARRWRGLPQGRLTSLTLKHPYNIVGEKRRVIFYTPPAPGPVPLLVVYDGPDYLRLARLATLVDNLISEGRIRPLAMALLANGGQARAVEYSCNDATLEFITGTLLPAARNHLDLLDPRAQPGAYGVLGASSGGLMALYTGLRLPHLFGHVLSQSGAFMADSIIYDLARWSSPQGLQIWMDVGLLEDLYEENQQMHDLLAARGYGVTYHTYPAGHNYTAWRDDVWRGLESLFGSE